MRLRVQAPGRYRVVHAVPLVISALVWLLFPMKLWDQAAQRALDCPDRVQACYQLWRQGRYLDWVFLVGVILLGLAMGAVAGRSLTPAVLRAAVTVGIALVYYTVAVALRPALQAPVIARLRDLPLTRWQAATRAAWAGLARALPFAIYEGAAMAVGVQAIDRHPVLWNAATLVAMLMLAWILPFVLPVALRCKPLPADMVEKWMPMADQACAPQVRFYLWPTRSRKIANAFAVGLWPPAVVVSDYLLDALPPDELRAVVGHELGHIRHRHVLLHMTVLTVWVLVVGGLNHLQGSWQGSVQVLMLALYLALGGPFLSRRAEYAADAFTRQLGIPVEVTASALERLGRLALWPRVIPWIDEVTMSHPSTAHRLRRLTEAEGRRLRPSA